MLPLPVLAQITHGANGTVDREAKEILKRAASRFDQSVSFDVEMSVLNAEQKQTMRQKAKVQYHSGRYHLSVEGQEVVCDGKTVWQWNKQAGEVYVSSVGAADDDIDLFNPARLLSSYDKSFKAKYIRTEDDGTAVVDLQPRSARNYHKIRLLVDKKSGLLRRIEVHRFDSGREVYIISHFVKANIPASQFTFDPSKHPGLETIDMR